MKDIIRTKHAASHITVLWFLLFSFGCSATPVATATSAPSITDTPISTNTPDPTATSQPSATPTATAVPLLISKNGRVIRSEHFDSMSTLSFSMYGTGVSDVADGHLILTDKIVSNGDPWSDGEAAGRSKFSPQAGNVSVFLFEAEKDTYFGYHFELYENTDAGEQYTGINLQGYASTPHLNFWKGKSGSSTLQLSWPIDQFKYDTWYYYSLQVQPDGFITAQLWERDQPANVIFSRSVQLDSEWAKPGFTFVVTAYQGKMEIDEYQEVELVDGATATP
jgi:hypothetical protein